MYLNDVEAASVRIFTDSVCIFDFEDIFILFALISICQYLFVFISMFTLAFIEYEIWIR